MKLNQIYGISNSRKKIEDYVFAMKNKINTNSYKNVIIRSATSEQDNIDYLLEYLFQNLKKNKIIKGIKQSFDIDNDESLKDANKESDFLIIFSDKRHRNIDAAREEIIDYLNNNTNKVLILVDNSDEKRMCTIRNHFGAYFTYYFEVQESTNKEKEKYICDFLKKCQITVSNYDIVKNLSAKPFYDIKSTLCHLQIRCEQKKIKEVNSSFLHKELCDIIDETNEEQEDNEEVSFESIIGMNSIKEQIQDIINYAKICKQKGQKRPTINMAFLGPPGVGKTSVARALTASLKHEGLLQTGSFMELNARDIIGQYVGTTATKTKEIINKARGGILFLDESYSLNSRWENGYEDEALSVLVQSMENYREDLIVIFAGYEKEMEAFINRNPGLKSRIPYIIHFDNYSSEELFMIFENMISSMGYILDEKTKPVLLDYFEIARQKDDFANGRECRNLVEKIIIAQSKRVTMENIISNFINESDVKNVLNKQPQLQIKKEIGFKFT